MCRSEERGTKALEEVSQYGSAELMLCDMGSIASVKAFGENFKNKHERLHVLVNNAGGMFGKRSETVDGLESSFAVNHLGYFLTTAVLLDALKASAPSRIISVSSLMHILGSWDFDNIQGQKRYSQYAAYGTSKLCNIAFTYELARRLEGSGVSANCLHPGAVATNFGSSSNRFFKNLMKVGTPFLLSNEQGAQTQIYLAKLPEVEGISGKYFVRSKVRKSSKKSFNEKAQKRLWAMSEEITGVSV